MPPTETVEGSASEQARQRIMEAAMEVFLRDGYLGAKTDEIAAVAGSSKQTIYKRFGSKDRLFEHIVLDRLEGIDRIFRDAIGELATTDDVETTLRAVAHRFVHLLTGTAQLRVRRLVIAEAGRFPQLGRAYFEAGPERVHAMLASCFAQLTDRGLLRVDEPELAANHFTWLIVSIPVNKVMFCGESTTFSAAELDHYADTGVEVFLAAYRAPGSGSR
ncbi:MULTISPECIES: TetR/AcrR family transcriptional regulator [Antrihabitans]|jgi:TetR/AcrR family transcriptional regulator, mexJK operon transcriptional repressor|uniref:TetR/AcrR family transcriptional regulator n=2 Tax=Antrihabitans TaxID=2799491 RepID=A0A934U2Q3_9NOCA|nr:TetR/AcrR family transcriptional regulator [Antrihabitans stalagmiti]MBJ8339165.1 TetR/AcrR family transcriptional regulator [Antrihabitans stalagmiti]